MKRPEVHRVIAQFNAAMNAGLIDEHDTSFIAYDSDVLQSRLTAVHEAFGSTFQHTVAVKTNPLKYVLEAITEQGFGLECASFEEVMLAQTAHPEIIAWDSPAKHELEIENLSGVANLLINANNLNELALIRSKHPAGMVSLRINPVIKTSSHASMSVAGARSKFGEPITNKELIVRSLLEGGVSGLHVHSSSQTTDYRAMVKGVQAVVQLADEINSKKSGLIQRIDIGGGFPAAYRAGESHDIADYASSLKAACPSLFDGTYQGVTEFGRYYHANAGFTAALVHDVTTSGDHQVLIAHAGADQFLREAYNPDAWHHDLVLIRNGQPVGGPTLASDIGGPLCFGADYLDKGHPLPAAQPGDWLLIRDTGANTYSLWSKHCSRVFPKVVDVRTKQIIKPRQSVEQSIAFWK